MGVAGAQKRIIAAVSSWDEVEIRTHRYGGHEFRLGKRELGHVHGDALVDIPLPKAVRDGIGALPLMPLAKPPTIPPTSGTICGLEVVPSTLNGMPPSPAAFATAP